MFICTSNIQIFMDIRHVKKTTTYYTLKPQNDNKY